MNPKLKEALFKTLLCIVFPPLWLWCWLCNDDVTETNELFRSIWNDEDQNHKH
jgi:hypothetical protein